MLTLVGAVALATASLHCAGNLIRIVNSSSETVGFKQEFRTKITIGAKGGTYTCTEECNLLDVYQRIMKTVPEGSLRGPERQVLSLTTKNPLTSATFQNVLKYDGTADKLTLQTKKQSAVISSETISGFKKSGNDLMLLVNTRGEVAMTEVKPKARM